jgi:predicted ATP-grasp superfamily ATP-dependent carboligase
MACKVGVLTPRTVILASLEELPELLQEIGLPAVLKPAISWSDASSERLQGVEVRTEREAAEVSKRFLEAGVAVVAQEFASGVREGVTLFVVGGEVRGRVAIRALRTTPVLGGASVLRETFDMPDDLYEASVRLVSALALDGISEVEFRRDREGRPLLMEVNARMAGPMETAVRAGVDFPTMLWEWASGVQVAERMNYRAGLRMRWLRGDMRWVRENLGRHRTSDSTSRMKAVGLFVGEFLRTWRLDCVDLRDPAPMWAETRITFARLLGR